MSIIKNAIEKRKYRKEHPCYKCEYVNAIGNNSPCFGCHNHDKWESRIEPDAQVIESNLFDIEEIHDNCTVQILKNSITGEISVGWWENEPKPPKEG